MKTPYKQFKKDLALLLFWCVVTVGGITLLGGTLVVALLNHSNFLFSVAVVVFSLVVIGLSATK